MASQLKGLEGSVTLNGRCLAGGWRATSIEEINTARIQWKNSTFGLCTSLPCFWRFPLNLSLQQLNHDVFLNLSGWGKGVVVVNNRNVGRFWQTSRPQKTIYIPASFLKMANEIVILETDLLHTSPPSLLFSSEAIWSND
jgi:beta-galactosidase